MVVVRGERADAFDEKLCVVCVVFEGKRGVCGVSLRRVSIETRLSFHINQSSNRFPGRTFHKMMMMMMMMMMMTKTMKTTGKGDDAYFSSATTTAT